MLAFAILGLRGPEGTQQGDSLSFVGEPSECSFWDLCKNPNASISWASGKPEDRVTTKPSAGGTTVSSPFETCWGSPPSLCGLGLLLVPSQVPRQSRKFP